MSAMIVWTEGGVAGDWKQVIEELSRLLVSFDRCNSLSAAALSEAVIPPASDDVLKLLDAQASTLCWWTVLAAEVLEGA